MSEGFTEQVVTPNSPNNERVAPRAPVVESITEKHSRGGGITESYSDGKPGRELPQAVRERIEKLEKEIAAEDVESDEPAKADPAVADEDPKLVAERAAAADPAKPVVTPPAAAPAVDEHKTRADTFEAANQKLVAELEAERAKPRDAAPAHKALSEASDGYIDDQLGSFRKFVATSLGIEDPNDKRVELEIHDFYTDLTAKILGVTPDPAHEAKRESARTRQLVDRDKRARKAEDATTTEKAQAQAEADKVEKAAGFIGNRLQVKRADGRSLADDHPLLTQFAESLDGMKPEALLWKVLERETKTGRIVMTADDDANIAAAAKLVEAHYQSLADKIVKATPSKSSTATTPSGDKPPAATTSASKETRQSPGTRNLTTADASVAPATPPATKPTTETKKPKFKSDKERREYALRHLPK